ncbi:MAG: gliding motility-associated C-terminal domain-containing protein [Saprospiraceae bacterium]|nr:gliding motility-associated C-terminal domain-containing protein [Saprospiraceae bacterium]
MRFWFCVLTICWVLQGLAQPTNGLLSHITFDACDAQDDQGYLSGQIFGNPQCECGIFGQSLYFNGQDDYIRFDGNLKNVFTGDVTLSFYFRPEPSTQSYDLFSYRDQCGLDSLFAISYNGSTGDIAVEIIQNTNRFTTLVGKVEAGVCWQHMVFVKEDKIVRLYINGELAFEQRNSQPILIVNDGLFDIANSPCLGGNLQRFHGYLDELRLYNRALPLREVLELYTRPDELITQDTTILKGATVQTAISPSCATSFSWNPFSDVADPSSGATAITPQQTTKYFLNFQNKGCLTRDSIKITVVDPTDLDCNNLAIPNAFTPNGDGINDVFMISNPYVFDQLIEFAIFSSMGEKVFSSTNPYEGWDGQYQGQPLNPGMYVYRVDYRCSGQQLSKSGGVALIR